jgi:hypothetical protein
MPVLIKNIQMHGIMPKTFLFFNNNEHVSFFQPGHSEVLMEPKGSPSIDTLRNKSATGTVDRYGLLGLLNVIRMTDQDLNTLALGSDLGSLGLNLNSQE